MKYINEISLVLIATYNCACFLIDAIYMSFYFEAFQYQVAILYIYSSKSLDVVQSLYFGSKLPSSGTYK